MTRMSDGMSSTDRTLAGAVRITDELARTCDVHSHSSRMYEDRLSVIHSGFQRDSLSRLDLGGLVFRNI